MAVNAERQKQGHCSFEFQETRAIAHLDIVNFVETYLVRDIMGVPLVLFDYAIEIWIVVHSLDVARIALTISDHAVVLSATVTGISLPRIVFCACTYTYRKIDTSSKTQILLFYDNHFNEVVDCKRVLRWALANQREIIRVDPL